MNLLGQMKSRTSMLRFCQAKFLRFGQAKFLAQFATFLPSKVSSYVIRPVWHCVVFWAGLLGRRNSVACGLALSALAVGDAWQSAEALLRREGPEAKAQRRLLKGEPKTEPKTEPTCCSKCEAIGPTRFLYSNNVCFRSEA